VTVAENKELVRRYFDERWNHQNYHVIDELLDPSLGIEETKAGVAAMHAAFADIKLTMEELIGEGDQVVVPWEVTGTHQGEYMGIAPSGEQVTLRGLALLRVGDSKIVSDVAFGNDLEVLLNK
jgi:predicted ester cyclase